MKICFKLLTSIVMLSLITGCSSKDAVNEILVSQKLTGVSMSIKKGSLTEKGATIIIKDTNGKGTYVYSDSFRIDKKEKNNWVKLKENGNKCLSDLMAYYVNDEEF